MTALRLITRRVAYRVAQHAARISPPERADWCQAMTHEMDHLPREASVLKWALGCVYVSYTERVRAMTRSLIPAPRYSSVYFLALPFARSTGYFLALTAILSTAASTRSTSSLSARRIR